MISVLSFNRIPSEQNIIEKGCRRETTRRTEDDLSLTKLSVPEGLEGRKAGLTLDLIFFEIKTREDVERLKSLRRQEPAALLMLLTSPKVSPMVYLKPAISPNQLLLRPFSQEDFDPVNEELFDALFDKMNGPEDAEDNFVIRSREGRAVFPYARISYFEACNKKVVLHTGGEEYDFYDSIDKLSRDLPDCFIRCHRAYLVNSRRVRRLNLAENLVEMDNGAAIPISRNYRAAVKDRF